MFPSHDQSGPFNFGTESSKLKKVEKLDVNTYYKFTKEMIREQLKELQKGSTAGEETSSDVVEFIEIKNNLIKNDLGI